MRVPELFDAIAAIKPLRYMDGLDMFAGYGDMLTAEWAGRVKSLTAWDERFDSDPKAKAAYLAKYPAAEVESLDSLLPDSRTWELVVADNSIHLNPLEVLCSAAMHSTSFVAWNVSTDMAATFARLYHRPPTRDELDEHRAMYGDSRNPAEMLAHAVSALGVEIGWSAIATRTADISLFAIQLKALREAECVHPYD